MAAIAREIAEVKIKVTWIDSRSSDRVKGKFCWFLPSGMAVAIVQVNIYHACPNVNRRMEIAVVKQE